MICRISQKIILYVNLAQESLTERKFVCSYLFMFEYYIAARKSAGSLCAGLFHGKWPIREQIVLGSVTDIDNRDSRPSHLQLMRLQNVMTQHAHTQTHTLVHGNVLPCIVGKTKRNR